MDGLGGGGMHVLGANSSRRYVAIIACNERHPLSDSRSKRALAQAASLNQGGGYSSIGGEGSAAHANALH
jgi:hypothetical protein